MHGRASHIGLEEGERLWYSRLQRRCPSTAPATPGAVRRLSFYPMLRAMWLVLVASTLAACPLGPPPPPISVPGPSDAADAATGFDNRSNGVADDSTHQADQETFDEVEDIVDGLGPLYNAHACRECHQNPTSGGASQVSELRVGHSDPKGKFQDPEIPINRGAEIIKGRNLVNDRAICPNAAFPGTEIQERVPDSERIRTFRVS